MTKIIFYPQGGFLTSWKIKGREVLYQGSEIKRSGVPLLFPFYGTFKSLPQHGFGRLSLWQIIKKSDSRIQARLTNADISDEFQKLYPYKFTANLDISAQGNSLFYQLKVDNQSDQDLPLAPALHPYWPVSHQDKKKIVVSPSIFNPKKINWDDNPPDTNFNYNGIIRAKIPDYFLSITDHSHQFNRLQLWSQNQTKPDFNFVCIEPLTSPHTISPNGSREYFLQFTIKF